MGFADYAMGNPMTATPKLTQAQTIFEQANDVHSAVGTLVDLGHVFMELGDLEEALSSYANARDQAKTIDHHRATHTAQRHIGCVLLEFGYFDKALEQFQESSPKSVTSEADRKAQAWSQLFIARAQLGLFKRDDDSTLANTAQKLIERVGRFARKCGDDNLLAESQVTAAEIHLLRHKFEQANIAIQTAFYVSQQAQLRSLEAQCMELQSQVAFAQDQHDLGLEFAQQALEMFAQQHARPAVARIHGALTTTFKQLGMYQKALEHLEAQNAEVKRIHDQVTQNRANLMSMQLEVEKTQLELVFNRRKNEELEALVQTRTNELQASHVEMIERLAVAAEFRDADTGEHTKRVGDLCAELASRLGWKPRDVELLRQAARLHDIGKIAIPDEILHKPGPLTADERDIINTHTLQGARMLENGKSELVQLAHLIALTHHERWDGQGYPRGISHREIPEAGRIVALADVFDALTHVRPYKNAWTPMEAVTEIQRQAGKQFDPMVVEVFVSYSRVANWPTDDFDHLFDPFIPRP